MEELPESVVKEFMRDIYDIRTKLDSWRTQFMYEKEKKSFLDQPTHRTSMSGSVHDSKDAASQHGSVSNESAGTLSAPGEHVIISGSRNNAPTPEETMPLVLETENDETWLLSLPSPVVPIREEKPKADDSLKQTEERAEKNQSTSTPKTVRFKIGTSMRTRIPRPPPAPLKKGVRFASGRNLGTHTADSASSEEQGIR